jgi:hypothetical protein
MNHAPNFFVVYKLSYLKNNLDVRHPIAFVIQGSYTVAYQSNTTVLIEIVFAL